MNGTFSVVLRYVQDPRDSDQSQANRDKPFFLKVEVRGHVEAFSEAPNNSGNPGGHNQGDEHVTLTLTPSGNAKIIESSSPDSLNPPPPSSPQNTLKTQRKIFLVKVSPQGKSEMDKEVVTFDLDAHTNGDRHSVYTVDGYYCPQQKDLYNRGRAFSWFSYDCTIASKGLYISSDLEPTYRKVTSASELPTKIDPNTNQAVRDSSKIRSDSVNGPWAVQNGYDDDGAGKADTVATWNDYQNFDTGWFGGVKFDAHASGFTSPDYIWGQVPGSIDRENYVSNDEASLDLKFRRDESVSYRVLRGIGLGGDEDGSGMTESSTATVGVSDANLAFDSNYTVNWHQPYEDYKPYGSPRTSYTLYDYSPSGLNAAANTNVKPDGTPAISDKRPILVAESALAIDYGVQVMDKASKFIGSPWFKALTVGAQISNSGVYPSPAYSSVTSNGEGLFNLAKIIQARHPELGVGAATPLVPVGAVHNKCYLKHIYHYQQYRINFYKGDHFDVRGYAGEDKKTVAKTISEGAIGRYDSIDDGDDGGA